MSKFATTEEYNETMAEWGVALAGFSPEQLKRGIDASVATMAWPPEIAEFIALAKADKGWEHRGAAYQPAVRAFPGPVRDRGLGRSALAGIKGALT